MKKFLFLATLLCCSIMQASQSPLRFEKLLTFEEFQMFMGRSPYPSTTRLIMEVNGKKTVLENSELAQGLCDLDRAEYEYYVRSFHEQRNKATSSNSTTSTADTVAATVVTQKAPKNDDADKNFGSGFKRGFLNSKKDQRK